MPVLQDVIERSRSRVGGRPPLVVFDLDGTLFDNGPRTWQILVDFAESEGNGALRRALDGLPRKPLPYLLKDTLGRCGVRDEAVLARAAAFWQARFFTDDFQRYDEPVRGSRRFVDAIFAAGASLVYLSGRDAPHMLVGCADALRRHGFPVGIPRTLLVLKHAYEDPDLEFKRDALRFMDDVGAVVATFDNEPANCNLFAAHWPSAAHFFVETAHAPDPPALHASVTRVRDLSHEELPRVP